MKYKILATLIASTLLAGCNDNDNNATKSVQAFDGAVWGIEGTYSCDGDIKGSSGKTDYDGNVKVTNPVFIANPETCSFKFVATKNAIDVSNGRDMSEVTYEAPKGLFSAGQTATVSPITTLIAKKLGDKPYDVSTATEVLETIGLGAIANTAGIDVTEFLQNTQASLVKIEKTDPKLSSKVVATTEILSQTLTKQPTANAADVADVAVVMTITTLEKFPDYPADSNGKKIYVDLTEQLEDTATFEKMKDTAAAVKEAEAKGESVKDVMTDAGLDKVVDAVETPKDAVVPERPADPDANPDSETGNTGGNTPTGGTGGTGSAGGTGGGTGV